MPAFSTCTGFCLLVHDSVCFPYQHTKQSRRIPSPLSSKDNSPWKLPDSSATFHFFAFCKLFKYTLWSSKNQVFFENFFIVFFIFFRGKTHYFQGLHQLCSIHCAWRLPFFYTNKKTFL